MYVLWIIMLLHFLRLSPCVREAPDFTNFVANRKEPNVGQYGAFLGSKLSDTFYMANQNNPYILHGELK